MRLFESLISEFRWQHRVQVSKLAKLLILCPLVPMAATPPADPPLIVATKSGDIIRLKALLAQHTHVNLSDQNGAPRNIRCNWYSSEVFCAAEGRPLSGR